MLEQTETMGRSGSAEIDLDQGKALLSKGLYALLGLPFPPKAVPSWRLLQRLPAKERGYAASIWQGALPDEPFEFQHRLVCSDGKRLEVLQRGMVETDGSGRRQDHGTGPTGPAGEEQVQHGSEERAGDEDRPHEALGSDTADL